MAHPKMFDDDDPLYQQISSLALRFPAAEMKVSHGRPAFYTKKIFAYYGGSIKIDGEYVQHEQSVLVLPDDDDRAALVQQSRVYIPAYLGPYGWIGVDLTSNTDWDEIAELIDASFRRTAGKRLIAELDAR